MPNKKIPFINNLLHKPATSTQKLDYGHLVHNLMQEMIETGLSMGLSITEVYRQAEEKLRQCSSLKGMLFPNMHSDEDLHYLIDPMGSRMSFQGPSWKIHDVNERGEMRTMDVGELVPPCFQGIVAEPPVVFDELILPPPTSLEEQHNKAKFKEAVDMGLTIYDDETGEVIPRDELKFPPFIKRVSPEEVIVDMSELKNVFEEDPK